MNSSENSGNVPHKEEPWCRKIIKIFGMEITVMTLIGIGIGIILTSVFFLSKPEFFVQPVIANAVRATVAAQPTTTPIFISSPQNTPIATPKPTSVPINPTNLVRWFDFENGMPAQTTLGICDNTPRWYDNCYESPSKFKVVSGGFTGENSLECQIEIIPTKEQVYSFRLPVNPPLLTDAVGAYIYTTHADKFSKITLAARIKGENIWVFSDMQPKQNGWVYYLVDVQNYKIVNNINREIVIDEIHIDIFVKAGTQAAVDEQVLIDDIKLYYPLSKSFQTAP